MASLKDAAERQAFSLAIDATLKSLNKDREKGLLNIVNLAQKFMGSNFRSEAYEGAKKMIQNPDSKWMRYVNRLLDETDPHVAKMTALNLGYQAAFAGTKKIRKMVKSMAAMCHGSFLWIRPVHATSIVQDAGQQSMVIN